MKVGINGFSRIGRLLFRALWGRPGIELVHVTDHAGEAVTAAHLLCFDLVHGRWPQPVHAHGQGFQMGERPVGWSRPSDPAAVSWAEAGVEMVLECTAAIRTPETLAPYFDRCGLKRVVVACPGFQVSPQLNTRSRRPPRAANSHWASLGSAPLAQRA